MILFVPAVLFFPLDEKDTPEEAKINSYQISESIVQESALNNNISETTRTRVKTTRLLTNTLEKHVPCFRSHTRYVSFRSRFDRVRSQRARRDVVSFFLRVLMSLLPSGPLGTMSLGKENGREMMMRDAFGRVRLEDHVARPKKKAARAGGSVRRTRAAWNRTARGPKSGQAKEDTRDCDDRAWFKIAISPRISRIASSRISIRAGASRTLWTTFERRENKKSLTRTFLFFFNANDRL